MTAAELEDLVDRFSNRTLPHSEWTHRAHLSVGMWHVHNCGAPDALARLRRAIRSLNDVHGTPNSATRGYHETITRAYVILIADYLASCPAEMPLDERVGRFLSGPLAAKDLLLRFYTSGRLMSVEARAGWVEPDLAPISASG